MPVLTLPGKAAEHTSLVPAAVSRTFSGAFAAIRRPARLPRWALVAGVAVLALGSYVAGRRHPEHRYVAYFGYPLVLDTTTGKACYAVPPHSAGNVQDAAFPLDGAGNSTDAQSTASSQIPLCGQE